jgi:putative transferase (TIGR04331 family)
MFLISTADENTWDTSKHICFVGEWCRRYSRRNIWQNLNANVIPYHWDDRTKYNRDYYYLDRVYEDLLVQLSDELDRINCVSNGIDYWRIVVGPWLRFFIDALFDRFEIIRVAGDLGVVTDTWILPYKLCDWVSDGFSDFYVSLNDDRWNHVIFAECIRAIGLANSEKSNGVLIRPEVSINNIKVTKKKLMRSVLEAYQKCILQRLNRHVFISPYLSFGHVARLQFELGQLPYLLAPSLAFRDISVDNDLRAAISLNLGVNRFELLLEKLIQFLLPKAYIENYHYFRNTALASYPKRPSTIFTSNAYQADDGFKFWVAEKHKNGIPLVIGQHGGNMGIAHHNQTEDHQLKIADSFCSWGWKQPGLKSICPLPSLQLSQSTISQEATGDILLVIASFPRYFYCHYSVPLAGQFLKYLTDQILLVSSLNPLAKALTRIRLNGDEYGWDIVERLGDAGLGAMIDNSIERLEARVSKCRLCIVTYNSTVILQTLAANFPTIAFWNPNLFDIRPDATLLVTRLREVGILHDTVESAAKLIDEIHDDVQVWWQRPELQAARVEFCNSYAKTSDTCIKDWADHLDLVALKVGRQ